MSSIDKIVVLEALGWSRNGNDDKHLPDEIIDIIRQFAFFDVRTEAYREHLKRENIKADKLFALNHMMFQINNGLRRYGTGKYAVEYNSIVQCECCTVCGEFISSSNTISEKITCSCWFMSEEEIMDFEYQCSDNYFWEEYEDVIKDEERRKLNREFYKAFGDFEDGFCKNKNVYYPVDEDPYSDWEERSDTNDYSSEDDYSDSE